MTRTAVWKQIRQLKKEGYDIESVPAKGYVFLDVPDKLFPREIDRHLTTKWLGRAVCYEDNVASTNVLAKQLATGDAPHGLLVVAETQGAGKGRIGRGWASPYGKGLWFSVILRPEFLPQEAPKCTLMAAVAVCRAINRVAGVEARIKWPNDILLNGKKLVGILSEMSAEFGHVNFVVIGVGINTHAEREDWPEEVQDIAVSLHSAAVKKFSRVELLAAIMQELETAFEEVSAQGFAGIFEAWRKMSCTLHKAVKVIAPDETYYGTALDIDEAGMLVVQRQDNGKIDKVVAGDVSIRYA